MNVRLDFLGAAVVMAIAAVATIGCGKTEDGPPLYHVSGSVTYNGQPLPRGTIQFRPDTNKGNSGPAASAEIVDGQYDTAKLGSGTVGGPHVVIIHGFDGNARPDEEFPMGTPLFSEYVTAADMPQSSGGKVDFQVDLQAPR